MTVSICVRETTESLDDPTAGGSADAPRDVGASDAGGTTCRFGVAVTTRLPAVGALTPFASDRAAVATQSHVNVDLARRAIAYAADGLRVDDALAALLRADEGAASRQVHGVGTDATFAFTGDDCGGWCGHREGSNYTVAGTHLAGASVVDAVADGYESGDRDDLLAERLVDALAAGSAAGGERREDLTVQSAALRVVSTPDRALEPYYNDLRVDATETPIRDLRETLYAAKRGYEAALAKYAEGDDGDRN